MRDLDQLHATMAAIQAAGGVVRTVRLGGGAKFLAGATELNGQAVADLMNDGWLIPDGPRDLRLVYVPLCAIASR
jgi:hypothetical protein